MHNIYNKKIITQNGTLIENWFEEGELRKQTGEGRSIRGNSFKKITFDPEVMHTDTNPRDNTYKRVIGEKEPRKDYSLTSQDYGQNNDEILKYTHPKLSAKDEQMSNYDTNCNGDKFPMNHKHKAVNHNININGTENMPKKKKNEGNKNKKIK